MAFTLAFFAGIIGLGICLEVISFMRDKIATNSVDEFSDFLDALYEATQ